MPELNLDAIRQRANLMKQYDMGTPFHQAAQADILALADALEAERKAHAEQLMRIWNLIPNTHQGGADGKPVDVAECIAAALIRWREAEVANRDKQRGDHWNWQGDGQDFPESLTCPVLISANALREMLAAHAETREERDELADLLDLNEAIPLPSGQSLCWCDETKRWILDGICYETALDAIRAALKESR